MSALITISPYPRLSTEFVDLNRRYLRYLRHFGTPVIDTPSEFNNLLSF